MMGSFDVNAKPGTIDLGALASTRMACPDMTVENNVLSALNKVKKYKKLGKGKYSFMRCFQSSHSRVAEERIRFQVV